MSGFQYSEPYFNFSAGIHLVPKALPKEASALTVRFSWLTAYSAGAETVYLYNIHNADAFSFRLMIHFCGPLVYAGPHAAYEISNWRVCQR